MNYFFVVFLISLSAFCQDKIVDECYKKLLSRKTKIYQEGVNLAAKLPVDQFTALINLVDKDAPLGVKNDILPKLDSKSFLNSLSVKPDMKGFEKVPLSQSEVYGFRFSFEGKGSISIRSSL